MSIDVPAGNGYERLRSLERRVEEIEKTKPAVIADRMDFLTKEVRSLRIAFYTFAVTAVGSAVAFAFTVFDGMHK
jgi:hypothetical protein